MRKTGLAMAASAALLLPAAALGTVGDLKGFGSASCGELAYAWNTVGGEERAQIVVAVGQWAFGYLSGRNAERPLAARKNISALDNDETAYFILDQCAEYPQVYVYQVVDVIFEAAPAFGTGV